MPEAERPSLSRILSIQTPDLESQEHIIRYQLPVAIKRQKIGLVVIDSIASNYRAEFDHSRRSTTDTATEERRPEGQTMADRKSQLVRLGAFLRDLARKENIAVVVSNQVADRMSPTGWSQPTSSPGITPDPLALDHQMRWFTGWGDQRHDLSNMKTPSLGLVWTNQISARIALIRAAQSDRQGKTQRRLRLVFAPWSCPTDGAGVEYEITMAGIAAVCKADGEDYQPNEKESLGAVR